MKRNWFKWFCLFVCAVALPLFCVGLTPTKYSFAEGEVSIVSNETEISKVNGDFSRSRVFSSEDALDFFDGLKNTFNFSSSREALKFNKTVQSVTGIVYRFDQYRDGFKVYGGELNLNVNKNGVVKSVLGTYYINFEYNNEINFTYEDAFDVVSNKYQGCNVEYVETNIIKTEEDGYIAYMFDVESETNIYKVFVSARTLNITREYESTASALRSDLPTSGYKITNETTTQTNYKGQSVQINVDKYTSLTGSEYFYILGDGERNIYVTEGNHKSDYTYQYYESRSESGWFSDASVAVQAYEYIMKCYDFYADSENFGISFDGLKNAKGQKIKIIAIVHFDNNYENAAFTISGNSTTGYFIFGDGNPLYNTDSFVQGLDVVGHEYQHAVTDSVVQLEYMNASGALSEAYSDIFGAVIEGNSMSDPNFWRMGEDIYKIDNKYFRDMSNPSATGCSYSYTDLYPFCTSNTCSHANCDNGGVHYNATLMTYATYIMYQRDPAFFTTYNILSLWYQALTKLTKTSDFEDFAVAMLDAADDLSYSQDKIRDIEFAFASINLPGYTGIEIWNNNSLTYLQGSGTITSPYLINSVADLASVAYYVNNNEANGYYASARYKVNVDLDLQDVDWIGIGTEEYPFNGVFNGNYKTISGLNLTSTTSDEFAGLFRYVGVNGYIYDINVDQGNVVSKASYVGAVVGKLEGSIAGCSSHLNIKGKNVGGLVGLVLNSDGGQKIANSFTTSDLEGQIVGGLASIFATSKNTSMDLHNLGYVSSCYTTGVLSGNVVGGLIGKANSVSISNSIVTGSLIADNFTARLGGFVAVLGFSNPLVSSEIISRRVSNFILSCKSTATFINQVSANLGLIFAEDEGLLSQGVNYIENTIVKKNDNYSYSSSEMKNNTKIVNTKISEDNIYQGDFDFDNEKYYKDEKNWTIINGIESFDLVSTFRIVGQQKMPEFQSASFWIDNTSSSFSGGDGSVAHPYEISTAQELALLSRLLFIDTTYPYYASLNYKLTSDIDLAGYIWVGIGFTKYEIENGVTKSATLRPFTGTFDGSGYTILNMSTVGAYSVSALNTSGTSYLLYELLPSLFGTTSVTIDEKTSDVKIPEVKNLTIEKINARGSYASGLVSKVYFAINVENVTIMGGNITSSSIAGGIIGQISGTDENITTEDFVTNIKNCYTLVNISGVIAGGAVGYATNATTQNASTLNVVNYLNRGEIRVVGDDFDSIYYYGSYAYYKATAGSVVGVTLIRNLNIINSINIGNIIAYTQNPMIGGFIGCIGVGDSLIQNSMNITIDGCKQAGKIYYIFDDNFSSAGSIIGATHSNVTANVTLTITETTYVNENLAIIKDNNMVSISTNSNLVVSADEIGQGDFDIYNDEYYKDSKYFNGSNYWDADLTSRLFFTITFRNEDGSIITTVTIKEGEEFVVPTIIPEKAPTVAFVYEFVGWSDELTDITRSQSVYAEFKQLIRTYTIDYLDVNGNVVDTLILEYGSPVNQDIEAPEKEGNFIFKYTFLRWGEREQTVTGDMQIIPIYKISLTAAGKIIAFVLAIVIFAGVVVASNKKKIH